MKKVFFLTLLFSLCLALSMSGQNLKITGITVDDITNEPLIGVSIVAHNSKVGTISDLDGKFIVSVTSNETLRFSYVGYETKEVKILNDDKLEVRLKPQSIQIDEFVVVGYTSVKKRDVLGAVSKVNTAEINKIPASSAQLAIQGRVAGVQVASQTGAPGSNISVRIRGVGSVTASNDPLYIVDGIPVENALNIIAPNDIEDISILKDASSAAIYGSRANNGVVLIQTKKGKSGESKISYNTQFGFQKHGFITPMANTSQYIEMYNEATKEDNKTASVPRALIEGNYLKDFADVNHLEEIFRVAPIQSHELSFSGGNEQTRYIISGNLFNQDGIIKNTNYDKLSVRSNINSKVKKWLELDATATGGYSNIRYSSSSGDGYGNSEGGSVVRYAFFRTPAIPVFDGSENYVDLPSEYYGDAVYNSFFGDGYSPEGLTANTDRTKKEKFLLASTSATFKLPYNISWKNTFGLDYNNIDRRVYSKTWGTANRISSTNGLSVSSVNNLNWTYNNTFSYDVTLKEKHVIASLIGMEMISENGKGLYMSDSKFVNTDPDFIFIGKGTGTSSSSQSVSEARLLSFFGSISYNYNQKYYMSATIREDGSSRFAAGNRWGTFFSVSGGWNIESESFMKDIDYINKLKLRIGYGEVGNQNIPLYSYLDRYGQYEYYAIGGSSENGYAQTTLGNANLKWETSQQFNAGIDVEFWQGAFGASLDYYYKKTLDMLVEAPLPPSVGTATPAYINNGNVLNTGIDLELFYRKNYKKGGFEIKLNGGYLHNEVLSLDAPYLGGRIDTGVYATLTEVGYPIGSFYLYEMDGIFQNELEILTSAYQGKDIKPGDVKYKDTNKDNVIDAKDRVHLGSAIPKFTTGLNLSGDYSGFDMSVFFQGAFGQKIYSQINHDIEGFYRGFNVTKRYYDERWTGEGTSNTQPRASWVGKSNNVKASSRFLEDGSYLRLKNIQIGYTVPNTQKFKIDKLRIYIAGTNLLTFTRYNGLDPEMTVSSNSESEGDRANGIDWGTYPVAKSYTLGLNITF
jgi:TonB-linked SusC/RagA family outer membrane protein